MYLYNDKKEKGTYSVKDIPLKNIQKKKVISEIAILKKIKLAFVFKCYDSFAEKSCLYILF